MSDVIRRDDLVMGPREKAIAAVEAGDKEEALKQIEALHMLFSLCMTVTVSGLTICSPTSLRT